MNSTPSAPLNAVEHQLATVANHPQDRAAVLRLLDLVSRQTLGVAGRSYGNHEFTPYVVGSRDNCHAVAFTHPMRFDQFRAAVRPDADVATQPLTGRQTFERCVPSGIPLLLNPNAPWTYEFSLPVMTEVLRGSEGGVNAQPTQASPLLASPGGPGTGPIRPMDTPVQGTPRPAGPGAVVPPGPPAGGMPSPVGMPPSGGPAQPATTAPPFVVPGLYERLAHYFDWLAGIDEAMLGWQHRPDGPTYLLRIRTRMPAGAVHAHLGQAIGDLQGQRMDVVVDDWNRPAWTDPVPSFYRARR